MHSKWNYNNSCWPRKSFQVLVLATRYSNESPGSEWRMQTPCPSQMLRLKTQRMKKCWLDTTGDVRSQSASRTHALLSGLLLTLPPTQIALSMSPTCSHWWNLTNDRSSSDRAAPGTGLSGYYLDLTPTLMSQYPPIQYLSFIFTL